MPRKQLSPHQEPAAHAYHGLAFSDDGDNLFALLAAQVGWVLTWSLESGQLASATALKDVREFKGPPIPGPEPNTVIVPDWTFQDAEVLKALWANGPPYSTGAVVDARTGRVLTPITVRPLRRSGDGLLALSNLKSNPDLPPPPWYNANPEFQTNYDKDRMLETRVVKTADVDRETIRAQLAQSDEVGPPPARPGDRTGLTAAAPSPPAAWTPPPKPPAPPEGLIGALNVPNTRPLFGDAHVGFISRYVPPADPKRVEELQLKSRSGDQAALAELQAMATPDKGVLWLRYDLRTGQPDPPVELGPLMTSIGADTFDFATKPVAAAMARDGARLVLRNPADVARVDVWDFDGTRSLSFLPYGPATPVQWVGWSGDGRLLTIGGGKFTGWDVPAGQAVFEVEGGYKLPAYQVRGGTWVAAASESHVDLLDAESGKCLSRCTLEGEDRDPARPADLALSPDGNVLAHFAWRMEPEDKSYGQSYGVVTVWDLRTGTPRPPVKTQRVPGWPLVVLDEHRVLIDGSAVVDLRVAIEYARYAGGPLPSSPDGRLWAFGPHPEDAGAQRPTGRVMLRPVELPGYDSGPTGPEQLFTKKTPLVVEVDMGDEERSRAFGRNLLKSLQGHGYTIGKGGWTLRASHEVGRSESFLTIKGSGGKVNVPQVVIRWKLYAPDGELAHATSLGELGSGRKHYKGERVVSQKGIEQEVEYSWDFGDRDPHEAMVEELLEGLAHKGELQQPIPLLGKFQGKYQPLPVETNAAFPPVPVRAK